MDDLTTSQRTVLDEWFGTVDVLEDHSWPLQDTTVLRIRAAGREFIVKASRTSHHIDREIAAHRSFLVTSAAPVPKLVYSNEAEKLLVTEYLPGELVEGSPAEEDPSIYRQAGRVLAELLSPGDVSDTYMGRLRDRGLSLSDRAARLVDAGPLAAVRNRLEAVVPRPVPLFFTHGDYQPRNWLVHAGTVAVIDFGRAEQRPWTSDLVRLQFQQFVGRPDLEEAFHDGLGRDLDALDIEILELERIYQAVSTVVWANGIGDAGFEEHGRQMIDRLVDRSRLGRAADARPRPTDALGLLPSPVRARHGGGGHVGDRLPRLCRRTGNNARDDENGQTTGSGASDDHRSPASPTPAGTGDRDPSRRQGSVKESPPRVQIPFGSAIGCRPGT